MHEPLSFQLHFWYQKWLVSGPHFNCSFFLIITNNDDDDDDVSECMMCVHACVAVHTWKSRTTSIMKSVLSFPLYTPGTKLRLPDLCGNHLYPLSQPLNVLFKVHTQRRQTGSWLNRVYFGQSLQVWRTHKIICHTGIRAKTKLCQIRAN